MMLGAAVLAALPGFIKAILDRMAADASHLKVDAIHAVVVQSPMGHQPNT